jgi:hypothetical protein
LSTGGAGPSSILTDHRSGEAATVVVKTTAVRTSRSMVAQHEQRSVYGKIGAGRCIYLGHGYAAAR